jgi:hypothetical protein
MKKLTTTGVFAALLLMTAAALAEQSYQSLPFPAAANTALANSSAQESSASAAEMPSSIAGNEGTSSWRSPAQSGSPFPSVANPSYGKSAEGQSAPSLNGQRNGGSPFPSAANPSGE